MLTTERPVAVGGALTKASSWRATFYFIAGLAGLQMVRTLNLFDERVDRLTIPLPASQIGFIIYPDTWRKERSLAYQIAVKRSVARAFHAQEVAEAKRKRKEAKGLKSSDPTPAPTRAPSPLSDHHRHVEIEVEKAPGPGQRRWWVVGKRLPPKEATGEFKVSITDINPLRPAMSILRSPVNFAIIVSSGILFASQYTIAFTSAITFSAAPYSYGTCLQT